MKTIPAPTAVVTTMIVHTVRIALTAALIGLEPGGCTGGTIAAPYCCGEYMWGADPGGGGKFW